MITVLPLSVPPQGVPLLILPFILIKISFLKTEK